MSSKNVIELRFMYMAIDYTVHKICDTLLGPFYSNCKLHILSDSDTTHLCLHRQVLDQQPQLQDTIHKIYDTLFLPSHSNCMLHNVFDSDTIYLYLHRVALAHHQLQKKNSFIGLTFCKRTVTKFNMVIS